MTLFVCRRGSIAEAARSTHGAGDVLPALVAEDADQDDRVLFLLGVAVLHLDVGKHRRLDDVLGGVAGDAVPAPGQVEEASFKLGSILSSHYPGHMRIPTSVRTFSRYG